MTAPGVEEAMSRPAMLMRPPVFNVLDVPVSAINMESAVSIIEFWAKSQSRTYVCITGAHGVLECRDDGDLLAIHKEAGMVTPDGMPLVWTAHAMGYKQVGRVYGPELMRIVSERAEFNKIRHYYYGGGEGIAERLATRLKSLYPALDVVGTFTPPFRPLTAVEDSKIVEKINCAQPDIVWVGLSTPKQERWMRAHRDMLEVPLMIGVGAAFDFLSGTKAQAPKWMQMTGLEWLFRVATEPRRLTRRYARIVPSFAALSIFKLLQHSITKFFRRGDRAKT